MRRLALVTGLAALALLSGCGRDGNESAGGNIATQTDNGGEFVVPDGTIGNGADGIDNGSVESADTVKLAARGLRIGDAGGGDRLIAFDTPRADTLGAVRGALGEQIGVSHNDQCGAGPMDMAEFPGGLTLYFLDGRFAGWDVAPEGGGTFTTPSGIGIGSTLKAMREKASVDVQANSSLGVEFNTGGLSGLVASDTPTGTVTRLWAGNSCIFR
ncbi:MAG: hypothetical protein ABW182_01710 [Sphingomonas sp.]